MFTGLVEKEWVQLQGTCRYGWMWGLSYRRWQR